MNMCSAYTHIFADTMRSIAVLIAALVAELSGASGEFCDSVAAIIVSVIIGLSATPLIFGLRQLWVDSKEGLKEGDRQNLLRVDKYEFDGEEEEGRLELELELTEISSAAKTV